MESLAIQGRPPLVVLALLCASLTLSALEGPIPSDPMVEWKGHVSSTIYQSSQGFYASRDGTFTPFSRRLNRALATLTADGSLPSRFDIYLSGIGYKPATLKSVELEEFQGEIGKAVGHFEFFLYDWRRRQSILYDAHIDLAFAKPSLPLVAGATFEEVIPWVRPDSSVGWLKTFEPLEVLSEKFLGFVGVLTPNLGTDPVMLPVTRVGMEIGLNERNESEARVLWVRTDHLLKVLHGRATDIAVYSAEPSFFSKWPITESWRDFTLAENAMALEPSPGVTGPLFATLWARAIPTVLDPRIFSARLHVNGFPRQGPIARLQFLIDQVSHAVSCISPLLHPWKL